MLCIHADNAAEDVALHIHFTLMEAFCTENYIRLFKVSVIVLLATIVWFLVNWMIDISSIQCPHTDFDLMPCQVANNGIVFISGLE